MPALPLPLLFAPLLPPPLPPPLPFPRPPSLRSVPVLIAVDELNAMYAEEPGFGQVFDVADLRLVQAFRPFDDEGTLKQADGRGPASSAADASACLANGVFVGAMSHARAEDGGAINALMQNWRRQESAVEVPTRYLTEFDKKELKACLTMYSETGLLSAPPNDKLVEFLHTFAAAKPLKVADYCSKATKIRELREDAERV